MTGRFLCMIGIMLFSSGAFGQEVAPLPGKAMAREMVELAMTQMKDLGTWRKGASVLSLDFPPINGMSQDESDAFYFDVGDSFLVGNGIKRILTNMLAPPDITGIPIVAISIIQHEESRYLLIVNVNTNWEDEQGQALRTGRTVYIFVNSVSGTVELSHISVGREGRRG